MAVRHVSRTQAVAGALSLLGLVLLALMVLQSHSGGQTNVISQLERPATAPVAHVGPGPVSTSVAVSGYTVGVQIPSNRASRSQVVQVRLNDSAGPVNGATVTVSYSMPSMNMPSVLTTTLRAGAPGAYSSHEPALVMPGDWLLSLRITPSHGRPLSVALTDRMPG